MYIRIKRRRKVKVMDAREFMREMGRKGGKARADKLTPKERRDIAIKASKQAAKVRKEKAQRKQNDYKESRGK